ncbi:hypothetical protein ACP70R_013788 [Stipagrostis hirtigluma subsp. patula]
MARRSASMAAVVLLAFMAVAALRCAPAAAKLPRVEQPAKDDGSLSLLVVGDWGRKGAHNQSRVARQMGKVGKKLDIDFIISTGDNFYDNGLEGVDDDAFEESFTDIYTAKSLQKPWYLVLGNHDYRGDALAQLDPVLRKIDSRFSCMRSFIVNAEDLNNKAMKKSTASWKIVVGHHTMRSVSEHGDTKELLKQLLPVLKDNGVDFYINGHDHCLEHISSRNSPIQYFTSGGGSKAWRGVFHKNKDKLRFFYDGQGFMSLQLKQEKARFIFYDASGEILYKWRTRNTNILQPSTDATEE